MRRTYDAMHAFAAYGHLVMRPDAARAEEEILAAAQAENRLPEADIQAYLNSEGDPEAPSPFGVHVVEFGTNASNCFILASYYTRTRGTDPIGGLEVPAEPARESLTWGLKALGIDEEVEEPEWFLGWYRLTF